MRSAHFEPEPVVLNAVLCVFYTEGPAENDLDDHELNLRVITIDDQEAFDESCADGDLRD